MTLLEMDKETFNTMWDMSAPGRPAHKFFMRLTMKDYYASKSATPHPLAFMPDVSSSVNPLAALLTFPPVQRDDDGRTSPRNNGRCIIHHANYRHYGLPPVPLIAIPIARRHHRPGSCSARFAASSRSRGPRSRKGVPRSQRNRGMHWFRRKVPWWCRR